MRSLEERREGELLENENGEMRTFLEKERRSQMRGFLGEVLQCLYHQCFTVAISTQCSVVQLVIEWVSDCVQESNSVISCLNPLH